MMFALETIARSSLVLVVGFATLRLLRAEPAALRHWLLAAGLMLAAAQPALNSIIPAWSLPWIRSTVDVVHERHPVVEVQSTTTFEIVSPADSPAAAPPAVTLQRAFAWIWAAGTLASLGAMLIGAAWLAWLTLRSSCAGSTWTDAEARVRRQLGLRRPVRILVSRHPALLVTWGAMRPVVLLPAGADAWPADRVQTVVAHELAHVSRGDWLVQILSECLCAINWFNPLFWIACARLRRESEHACDDTVLGLGIDRTAYAAQLVELARAFTLHGRTWLPAPSMARPSTLERRVRAMLNPQMNRAPVSLARRAALVALLFAVALPIAAATQPQTVAGGTIADPSGLPLPDAVVRLAPVVGGESIEARSDRAGAFQFASIPPGEYMLSARYPGFATQRERVQLSGPVTFQLRMQIGNLSETVTVRGGSGIDNYSDRPAMQQPPAPACGSTEVGGNLKPPMKLKDVRPRYRKEWLGSGLSGNILLEAHIGIDGRVRNVQVVSPNNPELEDEALATVSQWEFSPTYLNCQAIEVRMFVTVAFQVEQ